MKKLLSVIFSTLQEGLKGGLLFLALIVSTSAIYASDTQVDGIWYDFNRNTKTASVTYKGSFDYDYPNEYSGEVTIPETVTYYGTTYSVTSIGDEAFYGCSSLTSVTIPNSVTSIGDDAFYNCSSLTSITIPNSVTSIGWYAFGGCSSLTSVTIGESVTSIGYQAFYECTSLTSITITNSVTSIGDEAFRYCSSLTSVTIGNSVTIIGSSAFNGCSSLTSITIPNSVTSLGRGAFYKCSSLTSVTIGNSVTNIGEEAFYGCSKLTSVTINSDAIVNKAYSSSSNISDIFGSQVTKCIIGDEVTGIGNYAFSYCSKLTSVTLPNSVTSIGEGAFSGCSALTSVTIPNSVTSIADYAFLGCSSLTSVTVGNSVTSIGEGAFSFCSSLTSITIPNSVTSIGDDAFYNCSSLTSIIVEKGNSIYDSRENCNAIIETAINTLIAGCQNTTIPNSVTSIGSSAFGGHSSLTSITIPNSVTSIGDDAFRYCSSLTSVTIGNSVTSIGASAFYGCRSLKSITIPNSVTNIGGWAFSECSALTSVTIPNSVTSIEDYAFSWCSSLTSITIPNSVTSIGSSAFSWCSQVTMQGTTPPSIAANTFNNNATIFVPCSAMDAYLATPVWQFLDLHGLKYNVYLTAIEGGSAKITAAGCESNSVTIEATPNFGYHFVQWSDGNTDNPRSLILTQDTTFTAEFAPNQYTVTTLASHSERGTTQGDTTVNYLDFITISAAANYGYHFTQWNDGKTDNPRQVQVTKDTIYTAYFDKNTYYITKNYDSNQGYVDGYSSGEYLDNITLTAEANYGYHFVQWSDGNTDNPRHFVLTQDTTFAAEFAQTFSGQCGDNLYWSYQNNSLTISGFGDMYNERPWGLFTNEIQTVVLPNGITHIGNDAFSDCTGLSEITIPYTVTSIGDYAFAGCRKLVQVNCYAINPPIAESTSFANYNVYLNVPCDNLQDYQLDMVFGSFKYIQCMEADSENVPTDDVVVTPGTNDVTITWPTEGNADTYTIVIKKGDTVFCTLTFNADGQLLNIAFAPGRNGNNRTTQYATQTINGLRFTITGLNEGTHYTYDITAKDTEDNTLQSHSGEFTTQSNIPSSIDNTPSPITNTQKILRKGQLLILRDGKTYNIMGAEIK